MVMYVSFIARNTASRRVCKIGIIVGYVDRIVIVRNVVTAYGPVGLI